MQTSGVNLKKQAEAEVNYNDYCPEGDERRKLTKEDVFRNTFEDMELEPALMENIRRLKWSQPTPIQCYAIETISRLIRFLF